MRAEDLARDLEQAALDEPEDHAQCMLEAAGYWHLAGRDDRAREIFEQYLDTDQAVVPDPRLAYADFLLDVGEEDRARELADEAWRDAALSVADHEFGGEIFEVALGEPETALHWYNRGVALAVDPTTPPTAAELARDVALLGLFAGRRRVREQLGHVADDWDALAAAAAEAARTEFAGRELPPPPQRVAVLYFPRAELAEYLRRWPGGYPGFTDAADPHTDHRREVERALRNDVSGVTLAVATGAVARFAEFAERHGLDPTEAATRARYAAHLGNEGAVVPWPPGRNDRCWCGSGRKYKKCCGSPGFLD
ncbi:SEC-C motif-containing protein [Prauserella shujinwangii]|uniref:SEC-C motif-containing protein n=1 Tax=Prauserella shujinwangii TaxID=1453103 RepID=A0A2T0M0S6_9PSEU|nr:SEC-C metal-binding domain-containing protein [Prauserella shujinwangii]PRX50192.1 SEC-C motif-containing protein [Prauserella shujinwangii]